MVKHIKKTAVGLAALIALALGGSALAHASGESALSHLVSLATSAAPPRR